MNHLKTFENYSTLKDNEDPNIRPKWMVFAGLGGGFGGATEQGIFTGLKREAENISYQLALEEIGIRRI